jgi:hypothetical protein
MKHLLLLLCVCVLCARLLASDMSLVGALAAIGASMTASIRTTAAPLLGLLLGLNWPHMVAGVAMPEKGDGAIWSAGDDLHASGGCTADALVWNEIPGHWSCSMLPVRLLIGAA